ncbi:MAG: MOSC domain-containing protein [Actinomycetota bacterium]|nr:MOSC domain-containing protein [Actinomycetota bacterium]
MSAFAKIVSINISNCKGVRKSPASEAVLSPGQGIAGDAHGGDGLRELSLLAVESIEKMKDKGLSVGPGDFAENITTEGLELVNLSLGTSLKLGKEAIVRISKIGKECHKPCAIKAQAGECVMPTEGVFAEVTLGGRIAAGDTIQIID